MGAVACPARRRGSGVQDGSCPLPQLEVVVRRGSAGFGSPLDSPSSPRQAGVAALDPGPWRRGSVQQAPTMMRHRDEPRGRRLVLELNAHRPDTTCRTAGHVKPSRRQSTVRPASTEDAAMIGTQIKANRPLLWCAEARARRSGSVKSARTQSSGCAAGANGAVTTNRR